MTLICSVACNLPYNGEKQLEKVWQCISTTIKAEHTNSRQCLWEQNNIQSMFI